MISFDIPTVKDCYETIDRAQVSASGYIVEHFENARKLSNTIKNYDLNYKAKYSS